MRQTIQRSASRALKSGRRYSARHHGPVRAVDLPPELASALAGVGRGARSEAARALSERYRAGVSSAAGHAVRTPGELAAYAAVRFPATYAAARAAFTACALADPAFAPESLLDVGTGLGATACAALATWPSITRVTCVEPDTRAVAAGREVLAAATDAAVEWVTGRADAVAGRRADLVTTGYVGNELADPVGFATDLWAAADGVLVLLEPGRHDASHALLVSRAALVDAGATTLAPCPHDNRCPLQPSDWCHFGQRLVRTAAHRQVKGAELNHEDEKYSFVALARRPAADRPGRVIRRPVRRKGLVELRVCAPGGIVDDRVPRSDPRHRAAKDVGWGDAWAARP